MRFAASGLLVLLLAGVAVAQERPGAAAIASAHPLATEAGHEILSRGGNAFDAAVAVTAALGVVEPYGSGIGGGGFFLLHRASDGFETMLDARETAPGAAHRDMYLDDDGEVIPGLSVDGPLSAGIPGMPAALVHLAEQYGELPLADTLAPAARLAREGFPVDAVYRRMATFRLEALSAYPEATRVLLHDGGVPPEGTLLRQPDLADTLERLGREGFDGFYRGELAELLVEGVRDAGGIWTLEDLENYSVVEREPVRGEYRGFRITAASPPSSGGVALISILNQLAHYDLEAMDEATRTHLMVEAMRRAYRDRAEYLGDPDFVDMPLARLMSLDYAAGLRATIHPERATPSELLPVTLEPLPESEQTSHFSVLDANGNRVAATITINYPFGSGFMPPGTGVLLNDEMDDFSAKPGAPNVYGLVGAEANAIEPGKRMLSSMTPAFIENDERVVILGTPGGSRIITMVLLGAKSFMNGGDAQAIVSRPRFHHQYLPDEIQFEVDAFDAPTLEGLQARGHTLAPQTRRFGNMQAIIWDRVAGEVSAASDPRGIGEAR
ncbi:gamma-glutamyltransferase [Thioalkalivibrio denitrificans]|uniref:Glutathione hydrolase proenzyme n=1 Tax=Thioalkalivibrio denitrificans TaxID=108003 RepID=A0A1V3NG83_9GAMM|nr:gamma-glutamyltransferase [Thioalkalivibrio denitrificans]